MTGDRLRKRVRRIVERDIAAGAHSTSLLHADILALLDADLGDLDAKSSVRPSDVSDGLPDTPTADDPECCASGRCEVCSPGFDWARNGALPDAPVDDGLVEQIARVLDEYLGAHLFKTGDWSRRNVNAMARAVVVARPWQAEVDAARQDALNQAADEIAREAKTHPHTISESAHRVWLAGMDHAARVVVRLRDRAARGETRQP